MENKQITRAEYEARRKRRKRKILIRRLFLLSVTAVILAFAVVIGTFFANLINDNKSNGLVNDLFGTSKRVEKAKELEIPDWIDVQLIHKHTTARTGINLKDIKNIVIHYVGNPGTSAQNNRDYFDKITTTVSSHFVVGLQGEIIQCVPLYEKSAASNNRNKDTISIEVCHPDDSGKYNDATYASVIKLASWLCENFSLDENDIIRHYDITGKICPKYYVEHEDKWLELKEDVKQSLDEKD